MKKLIDMCKGSHKWRLPIVIVVLAIVVLGSIWLNMAPFRSGFEIADELGGTIFPSSILSVARMRRS